jgi:SNF2 family DNA or RNA helicase
LIADGADPGGPYGLSWRFPLHGFQLAGVARLLASDAALLADEMGLGKTIQAIAALRVLVRRGDVRSALVIVPVGLLLQWRQQFRTWAPELSLATVTGPREDRIRRWRSPAQIFLVGYEVLRNDRLLPAPFGPGRRTWDVVVADEAQRIKNDDTELSMVLKSLIRTRSWALTGTPVENRAEDAASIIDFIAPGRLDRREMMFGLRRALGELQLRRRRAEVLPDLPPKTGFPVEVMLGPAQRAAYDRAEREGQVWLRSLGAHVTISHVLELILRLKQICNACPQTGASAKRDDLLRRVAGLVGAGEKVLVFSQFVAEPFGVCMLARHLAAFRPVVLAGGMLPAARERAMAIFARDPERSVMVLSLRAGGIGLNLTAASAVFHFDRWWNPAVEAQAEDRAHRIGQTRPVQIFAYLCPGTVEQRIAEILAEKQVLFADLVDDVAVSGLRRLDLPTLLRAVGVAGDLPLA